MDTLLELATLAARWVHLITGIAWIGASFYFVWLDNSLAPAPAWKREQGVQGDLWSFHGGGIYEVAKYRAAPPAMPETLHWFYWEAYSTWLSGMVLLVLLYYLQASSYLVAPAGWVPGPGLAVIASLAFIGSGLLAYEALLRLGAAGRPPLFIGLMILLLALFSWLASQLFAPRAAYLHVGILMGTIMVGNVLIGIIPPQRAFVRAIAAGGPLPVAGLVSAKLRSTHNNYLTLPVLFCMISNHYPLLYGHRFGWLLLVAIIVITGTARHFFNLRHRGIYRPSILVGCAALFIILGLLLAWERRPVVVGAELPAVDTAQVLAVARVHCTVCHADKPTWPGFAAAPAGIVLETAADFRRYA
ncbi:MAG TPA: urate hydroxylase PuuD, partial [Kineobactrum sp.]